MADQSAGQSGLENAYGLQSPDDNRAYYAGFAATYDTDFAEGMGWDYPRVIARIWRANAAASDLPVADIGCGTGYVAAELGLPPEAIDGMDISPDMLAIARGKGLYRSLHEVDLTGPLDALGAGYGSVVSAGTFTHGHLGPEPLAALLGIARPGALFVIGVNQRHFETRGFAPMLEGLVRDRAIDAPQVEVTRMYTRTDHAHADDRAMVLRYRKVGPPSPLHPGPGRRK
jgi:SAM-dependent methyltransferase